MHNILQAQERFESLGVDVKRTGELPELKGPAGKAYGLPGNAFERCPKEAKLTSRMLLDVILVLDPDGNLVEVQSLPGRSW